MGHPLQSYTVLVLEKNKSKVDISHISRGKKIISIFPGSRMSELKVLLPILIDFIKLMNKKIRKISKRNTRIRLKDQKNFNKSLNVGQTQTLVIILTLI